MTLAACVLCILLLGCSSSPARPPAAQQVAVPQAPAVPNLEGLLKLNAWNGSGAIPSADLSIIKGVLHELMAHPGLSAERLDLSSQGGTVTIKGVVTNPLTARRATTAAEGVTGVLAVVDEIEIHPLPRPDHEIERDVALILRTHIATAARKLNASVREAAITLEGSVSSLAEKKLVENIVLAVNGVREVDGMLTIDREPPRADHEIRNEIVRRLRYDARLDAQDVSVRVSNRVVRLSGSVRSAAERRWAREAAEVTGATAVDLRKLHVDPSRPNHRGGFRPAPTDTDLATAVQAALAHDPRLAGSELGAFVSAGIVEIQGRVAGPAARRAAEQTVAGVFGINRVINNARVRPPQRLADAEVARSLKRRLEAHPDVDATNLEVAVHGGKVSLSGTVQNEFEHEQAVDAASTMSGVVSVVDELRVLTPRSGRKLDAQLRRDISERLGRDPSREVQQLGVEVLDGVVTLSGRVADQSAHERAMLAATGAGARRIVDDLDIALPGDVQPSTLK